MATSCADVTHSFTLTALLHGAQTCLWKSNCDIGSRYEYHDWTVTCTTLDRVIAALKYPDRLCRIAISLHKTKSKYNKKLLAAMCQPFLALESLELNCKGIREVNFQLPCPFGADTTPATSQIHRLYLHTLVPYITAYANHR
jgi:hypothetical protein